MQIPMQIVVARDGVVREADVDEEEGEVVEPPEHLTKTI